MSLSTPAPPVHPGEAGYLDALGAASSADTPDGLLGFFVPGARYADVASGTEWIGHEKIAEFFRHMLAFASDTLIVFDEPVTGGADGWWARWRWSGTAQGRLALNGVLLPRSVKPFAVTGVSVTTLDADGLITDYEDFYDMHAVLRDLGLSDV